MPANVALSAELAAAVARITALETRLTTDEARLTADEVACKALAVELGLDEVTIAKLVAASTVPAPAPAPTPTVDPQVQWKATFPTGDLSEWSEEVNSGFADTTVITALAAGVPARSGAYVMRQAVTGASGGTRMQRYPEVDALCRAGTPFYWSWWDYYPTPISFGPGDTFIIWGAWSVSSAVVGQLADPVWGLVFHNTGNTLDLIFSPNGKIGARAVYNSNVPLPVGRWNFLEAMILPRGDTTGAIKVWLNGAVLFDLSSVQTQFPFAGQAPLLAGIEQTGYGSGLTPTPCVHYVDDVTLSLGRMPQ